MEPGAAVPQVLPKHVQALQALQSGKGSTPPEHTDMYHTTQCVCCSHGYFFSPTHQLLELCEGNQGNQTRRHTCLLMSAAACLQMARETQNEEEKV